jgi:uncharacterized protein
MTFWPFWLGGLALAGVALTHYFAFGSQLAVSGRLTALVNRVRDRLAGERETSDDEMAAMLREMTAAEFGVDALEPTATAPAPTTTVFVPRDHVLFFAGLALGGLVSSLLAGTFAFHPTLAGELATALLGAGPRALVSIFVGGLLVGFGTRMSGGCTSGHGLIGVSRLAPASLIATACFFGAGIGFSLLMEVLR